MKKLLTIAECRKATSSTLYLGQTYTGAWGWRFILRRGNKRICIEGKSVYDTEREAANAAVDALEYLKKRKEKK